MSESRIDMQIAINYIEENLTEEMKVLYDRVKSECTLTEIKLNNISSISEQSMNNNKNYMTLMYENLSQLEALK